MKDAQKENIETPRAMMMIRKYSRLLAGIWFVVIGIIFIAGTYDLYVGWRSMNWPSIKGKIVEGGNFAPKGQDGDIAVVEYQLDGKRHRHAVNYRASQKELGVEDLAHIRQFVHGARVDIYYYPGDKSKPLDNQKNVYYRKNTILLTGIAPGGFDFIYFIIGIGIAAMLFWRAPDWVINRYQKSMADAMADPNKEIFIAEAKTATSSHKRIEIRSKPAEGEREPHVQEDKNGQVLFDSTKRPMRLIFGGFFFIIGLLMGLFIVLVFDGKGFYLYFFVCGWSAFTLFVMGYVYEIRLNKQLGIVDQKYGWFFVIFKQRFHLQVFNRVLVEKTFFHSRYDRVRGYKHSRDPRFQVHLDGERRLNLKVFSDYSDAILMGKEVAVYLDLPLEEASEVMPRA